MPGSGYPQSNDLRQRRSGRNRQQYPQESSPQQYEQQPYGYPQQPYGGYYPQQDMSWNQNNPNFGNTGSFQHSTFQQSKPPRKGGFLRTLVLTLVLLAIAAGGGVYVYHSAQDHQLRQYVEAFDGVFCQGVHVDGIHLGGMTPEQGYQAVQAQAQQRNDAWSVKLTYQGQLVTELRASHLGMNTDVTDVLNDAWAQGHTGDYETRKAAMDALMTTPFHAYTAIPGGDTSVVDSLLDSIRNQVYIAPQNAMITAFVPDKSFPFDIQPEVVGRMLDTSAVKEEIYRMVATMESGSIELTPTAIYPEITAEMLKQNLKLRVEVSSRISSTSTPERTDNIRTAMSRINGTILQPGETFSFNNVVGERSVKNGFYEAIEYAYDEEVMGVGGGVCQASTVMYQAAVLSGLYVTHREPHSREVNYCEYGKDATVYWAYGKKIDLTFVNSTEYPIYIVAELPNNRTVKVRMYGQDMGNVTYGMAAETVEVMQPGPTEYVKDKKAKYVTYVDEEKVVSQAKEGYVVQCYRVTYVNGKESERMLLSTDTYKARPEKIYVGVTPRW